MKKILLILSACAFLYGCTKNTESSSSESESISSEEKENMSEKHVLDADEKDSLIELYDQNRLSVEAKIPNITPVEVTSEYLREKVRQKWKKIHIYTENDVIIRIKSYPHETITDRTEEFYFHNGRLAMVVMENDGDWTQTQEKENLDKIFYFNDGKLFTEKGDESPYESWEDMGHELVQEAIEYSQIYQEALKREAK